MRNSNTENDVEITAIKALAVASKTPFKTAFKATLGVAAAQLVITVVFFGGLAAVGTLIYFIAR